jgi:hypothetical protein
MLRLSLAAFSALAALVYALPVAAEVIAWPMPEGETPSADYRVTADGKPVAVYVAKSRHGGDYAFCAFDFTGNVQVTVTTSRNLTRLAIRPLSANIQPQREGETLRFTLDRPRSISIEPDGINAPLLLFAGAPEKDAPRQDDPNVVYYGPGVHKPTKIILKSNQTLYLAGGAVVKAALVAENVSNVSVRGRGILDGTDWPHVKGPASSLVNLTFCTNVLLEGVILRGSFAWTIVPMCTDGVTVRNVKIVNSRVENDDGIDPCNTRNMTIEDCFIRTDDDCLAVKGVSWAPREPRSTTQPARARSTTQAAQARSTTRPTRAPGQPISGITMRRCVLWTDRARITLLGHESDATVMENISMTDCDVVHYSPYLPVFLLEPGEEMPLTNIRFENIRIEGSGQEGFITVQPTINEYMRVKAPGHIKGVTFRNITLNGPKPGQARVLVRGRDETHLAEAVSFENVVRYGKPLDESSPNVRVGPNVKQITFTAPTTAPAAAAPAQP